MPIIPVDDCGKVGLIRDAYSQEMVPNAWSDAKNFRFREGYAEKFLGHAAVYETPQVEPHFVMNLLTPQGNQWIYASLEKIYAIDTDKLHSNITRQSGGVDVDYTGIEYNKWTGGALSGIAILNNGIDPPQYWPGTGRCANLLNWPANTTCKVMRPFRNYLLALNVTENSVNFPHLVKWSDVAEPGTVPASWDVTDTTNDAGEYDLADDQTELVDGLQLGEQFIAYKGSGYYSIQYIGTPFIFRFQKISGRYGGAMAANCVTEFPGGHFVLGRGDVYIHQGGAPESVIDARNRKWLFRQLDSEVQTRSFVLSNPQLNELWVCFPQQGDLACTLALVWNWKYDTWGVRELPNVISADVGNVDFTGQTVWQTYDSVWQSLGVTWQQNVATLPLSMPVMASPTDIKLYTPDIGTKFDNTTFESYVSRSNVRFDKPNTVKLLKEVRPLIEGPVGAYIDVYINASYDQMADPQWYGPYPFRIGYDQKIDCHVVGRMLGVKFTANADFAWRIKRYDLIVEEIGLY